MQVCKIRKNALVLRKPLFRRLFRDACDHYAFDAGHSLWMDTCPHGDQQDCGGPSMQHHRLMSGQLHTFASYHIMHAEE